MCFGSFLQSGVPTASRCACQWRLRFIQDLPSPVLATFALRTKRAAPTISLQAAAPAAPTPTVIPTPVKEPQHFGELMAFSGPAPELINGRLAMLAVVAAIGAELSTGESVLRQLASAPATIGLAAVLFTVASLITMFNGSKREAFAFFTPAAEMANGRAAMLGFASLLVVEGIRGAALF